MTDPGTATLYAIEHAVLGPVSRRFATVTEARAHVDDLVASDWFGSRWPDRASPTVERRGSGSTWSLACSGGEDDDGRLLLAELDLVTVLHELAHLCRGVAAGHDDRFVATLLVLVRREMGAIAYGDLRHALVAAQRWPFLDDELEACLRWA